MKCGHSSNATCDGKPSCAICAPDPDSMIVDPNPPSLKGRMAKCDECDAPMVPSSLDLAFFEYRPDKEYDIYYNGCYGWD
jgi:hypothetical protein